LTGGEARTPLLPGLQLSLSAIFHEPA